MDNGEHITATEYCGKELPEFVYHYTSLQTLALILEKNKIRLNRLDNVNDLQEGRNTVLGDISKYVYISCWNASSEEAIYMWKLYGNDFQGVRIRMRPDFFHFYYIPHKDDLNKVIAYSLYDKIKMDGFLVSADLQFPFYKIQYMDNLNENDSKIFQMLKSGAFLDTNLIASYKDKMWAAEEEWRIKMILLPYEINGEGHSQNIIQGMLSCVCPKREFIDIDLFYPRIDGIEITIGPCMTPGDRSLLKSLIKEHSTKTKISLKESSLKGKIS